MAWPPRLTFPQRFDFGSDGELVGEDLRRPDRWDRLRLETTGAFALPSTVEEHRRQAAQRPDLAARARAIASLAGPRRVVSYGVGSALLERHLLDLRVELVVTEYAPRTVDRLARVLPEAEVRQHDLVTDAPVDAELHLLHRVETELDDATWPWVFAGFAARRVIVVPGGVVPWRDVPWTLVHLWRTRNATRTGWLRTPPALLALWEGSHRAAVLDLGGTPAWLLDPLMSR